MDLNSSDTNFYLPHDIFLYHLFFLLKVVDLYKFKYMNKAYYKILTPDLFRKNIIHHLNKKLLKIFGMNVGYLKKSIDEEHCIIFGNIILKSMLGKEYYYLLPGQVLTDISLQKKNRILGTKKNKEFFINENKILKEILGDKYNSSNEDKKVETVLMQTNLINQKQIKILIAGDDKDFGGHTNVLGLLENSKFNNFFNTNYQNTSFDIYYYGKSEIQYIRRKDSLEKLDTDKKIEFFNWLVSFKSTFHGLDIIYNKNHYFIENNKEIIQIYDFNNMMEIVLKNIYRKAQVEKYKMILW